MDKMDTPGLKKEWSCERWVQADTRANMKTTLIYRTAGMSFSDISAKFRQKRGESFSAFSAGF